MHLFAHVYVQLQQQVGNLSSELRQLQMAAAEAKASAAEGNWNGGQLRQQVTGMIEQIARCDAVFITHIIMLMLVARKGAHNEGVSLPCSSASARQTVPAGLLRMAAALPLGSGA